MAVNGGEWQANRRQQALIDRLSRAPYVTLAQACRELDIPIDTAGKWHRSPAFRSALEQQRRTESDQLRAELEAQLLAQGEAAIATKIALLTAQSEQVRHMASSYILDRILGKPTERTEQTIDAGVTLWEHLARRLHEGDGRTVTPVEQHGPAHMRGAPEPGALVSRTPHLSRREYENGGQR